MAPVLPWFAVVTPVLPWFAVVAPPPLVLAPPGWEPPPDGADEECGADAAFGAGADEPLFFWPQARLGTIIKLKSKSHLAAAITLGRVGFILLSSWCEARSRILRSNFKTRT